MAYYIVEIIAEGGGTMAAILIVEDDISISEHIESCICSMGRNDLRVLKAKEGAKALEIAEMMEVNVFVIDIGLPDCDGVELAKELRKTYPYHPIIIESSRSDPLFQTQVHEQIENLAFLCKPYKNEILILKITHALKIAENMGTNQLRINQNGFTKIIEINNILYIEKVKGKKMIKIVLYNQDKQSLINDFIVGLSLSALLELLENKRDLFRCHKGFIINPKMIERLNYAKNTINIKHILEEIPIGKTFKGGLDLLL